jgi:hypothetical protein
MNLILTGDDALLEVGNIANKILSSENSGNGISLFKKRVVETSDDTQTTSKASSAQFIQHETATNPVNQTGFRSNSHGNMATGIASMQGTELHSK